MFLNKPVLKGEFVCEYVGELLSHEEGVRREEIEDSVFRYFINFAGKHWWYVYCSLSVSLTLLLCKHDLIEP